MSRKTQAEKDILHTDQEGTKHEKTEMLIGAEATTKRVQEFFSNVSNKFDACANSAAPSIAMTIFRDAYEDMKSRKIKIRWVTDTTKDNLAHCKDLMQYAEVRHITSLNGNFGVSETEYIAAATIKGGQPIPKLIYSNSKEMVEQQQYIFQTLWEKAVPAEQRIKEIEQEIEPQRIDVIYDAEQALELYQLLIMSAEKEVKIVFPTTNALVRQDKAGILFLLQEAAKKCQVKVLIPNDELIRNFIQDKSSITTRFFEQEERGKATILIIDNRAYLMMELRDDRKKTFHEAIGLSTYSNSKAGVLSYVSMFESLWKQAELYEKLKINERMQKEFINIAAHELRTPIVPILNLSELLYSKVLLYSNVKGQQQEQRQEEEREMLEVILRNANRLHQLTEDILDVTRIESNTLKLRKERFNLNEAILDVIEDDRKQITNANVKVMYEPENGITVVEADRRRLTQVISNLLNNALKFTKEGTITVTTTTIKRKDDGDGGGVGGEIVVSVKDTGTGIDHELMPRLFTKFATKSYQGTGLGLFISKSIIEAHGGRMWAENNNNDDDDYDRKNKGATFYFTLPVVDMNKQTREE
jgi:two-component system sensor histidine kinase VicK